MGACKSFQKPDVPTVQEGTARSEQTTAAEAPARSSSRSRLERQDSLFEPLRENRNVTSPSDVWLQASFLLQLRKLITEHPYLELGCSAQPHPLQNWVHRCRESFESKKYRLAQDHLKRIRVGLKAESRPIFETFRRFDVDASGHLDDEEFSNLCSYLGWDEEKTEQMDLDRDGKVTAQDMEAFVGYMGGVQQFFEKRRLRITRSRKDVCDFSGLSVGEHVRSYFYVRGQKSSTWREAVIREVGVAGRYGGEASPATLGVSLEFVLAADNRLRNWRVRQVVPMSWVLGAVEDASVATSLRDVGILDEAQCFWAALLPDSEMHAMCELQSNQRAALALIRSQAVESQRQALAGVRQRFQALGFSERELQAVVGWVQDLAPIIIHVDMDSSGHFFESDDYYRSQFETKTGKGEGEDPQTNNVRKGWEHDMFGGLYDDAKPFERVKYGALNILNDYRGVKSASRYGDSYLVLKDVRLRCTFAAQDSAGLSAKKLGVLDQYLHILEEYSDEELRSLVAVAMAAIAPARVGGLPTQGPAELKLLRGATQDPNHEWITLGFPGLQQGSGRYYFEVLLEEGCCAPQVGLASSRFTASPNTASAQGVGDDEHSWAVDGQHSALWHGGCAKAWEVKWASSGTLLGERVVVGLAVDLDKREVRASCNGTWGESPVFGPEDLPPSLALYPAVSLKGRAEFAFGPDFRHAPPEGGDFVQWPGTPGGFVKVDCPEIGNSQHLKVYKEVQIHGEVSLRRNVQRLVANSKYRERPKTKRSHALCVSGAAHCSGTYQRKGAHKDMPLYKSDTGCVIYWDTEAALWKMNNTDDFTKCLLSAPPIQGGSGDVPRSGWRPPDEWHGVVEADVFRAVLEKNGLSNGDVERLLNSLTVKAEDKPGDVGQVYRVTGEKSLDKEWKQFKETPGVSADGIWDLVIQEFQQRFLSEAGFPANAHVVETDHPYEAKRASWTRTVEIESAKGLTVHFASKSCTRDGRAHFTIKAGGLQREAAGRGARVELSAWGGGKVVGTLEDSTRDGESWRVCLDRCRPEEATAEDDFQPAVGDMVEARYRQIAWYKGTVAEIMYKVDWYTGNREPWIYTIDWLDKDPQDRDKTRDQLRRQRPAALAGLTLEGLGRFAMVAQDAATRCYAVCAESPKAAVVAYSCEREGGKGAVGDEIAAFHLDRSNALTPISVGSFAGTGPAQEKGAKAGWFLDVVASALGQSRKAFAEVLAGLGGVELDAGEGFSDGQMNKLLDAAFSDLEGLLGRLNERLRTLSDVTLIFTNSASSQKAKLLPSVHAVYEGSQRVGSEVRVFRTQGPKVYPESFLKWGPAQEAGVRTDWLLDLDKTRELNPDQAEALKSDILVGNPNSLLALDSITLAFKQPSLRKTQKFKGSGPANSEKWKCSELPGRSADFTFSADGDGTGEPEKRWGVWALVLDRAAPPPSTQALDALADRWVSATMKARGIPTTPRVEREGWDEARLRALCARHGWEFEWMTEDGERRRRAHERQGFLQASGQLSGAAEAASAAKAALRTRTEAAVAAEGATSTPPAVPPALSAEPATFRFMTFNVEEYYHGAAKGAALTEVVFKNLSGIRQIFQEHSPDVICLQEHSMGKKDRFSEQDIINALIEGMDYGHASYPTGEDCAWFSALANVVLWKRDKFTLVQSWRVQLATYSDLIPGTKEHFTPRAATCVELKHIKTEKRMVVCATHLMGGRFEDKSFVAESTYGRCVRVEQVEKIAESIRSTCSSTMPSIIAGDFNVMNLGYREGSPFRQGAQSYFDKRLKNDALAMVQPPSAGAVMQPEECCFDSFYAPFHTRVHQVLDQQLGYVSAYGRTDDAEDMKTTLYSGCIDWIYMRNLLSMRDEQVIEVLSHGLSDHNAVTVTLQLR